MRILPKKIYHLLTGLLFIFFSACGGGGGGSSAAPIANAGPINNKPTVNLPANISLYTAGSSSNVPFTVTATDSNGSTLPATCIPESGTTFPVGTSPVTCSATNSTGTTSASFTVTVLNTLLPVVSVPTPIVTEATGPNGSMVNFITSAIDSNGSLATTCNPASGATFPLGQSTVTCTATNLVGAASNNFTVKVQDTTPPVVTVPSSIISGVSTVSYTASAFDLVNGKLTPTCFPPSPVTLTLGSTVSVTCTATDSAFNSASASFTVKYVQRGTANPMDSYIYNNMAVKQWKLWTSGTSGGFDSAVLPATRANYDGNGTGANGTWANDAAVAQTPSAGVGASGTAVWAYSSAAINPNNGDVLIRGGGHSDTGDGSIYGLNLFNSSPSTTLASWSLKVPSAKYIGASEPKPSGVYQTNPALYYSTTTTGTNSSGSTTLTVTSGANISNGYRIYVTGGTPTGVTVIFGGGTNTLTLSTALTGTVTAGTAVTASNGYWAVNNKDGAPMPNSTHTYWNNIFGSGTNFEILYLSGMNGFDSAALSNMGAAYAYQPSKNSPATNDGILGPFYNAGTTSLPFNNSTMQGYAQTPSTGGVGTVCANSHDGNLYTYGKQNGGANQMLWQITNASTSPTFVYMGYENTTSGLLGAYSNCVIFKDPVKGAGFMSYFVHVSPTQYGLWDDIESTPPAYPAPSGKFHLLPYTNSFIPTSSPYLAFDYNTDLNVLAVTDGVDIWEASFVGTTRVLSAWTRITASATGDIPTSSFNALYLPRLTYLSYPYFAYAMCNFKQCSVLRRQ